MEATSTAAVRRAIRGRLDDLAQVASRLSRQDRRLSTARGLSFVVAAGAALTAAFQPWSWLWAIVGAVGAAFVAFVVLHAVVSSRQFEVSRRREMLEQGLARMDGTFRAPAGQERVRGDRFLDATHDYAADLDLFGTASLFEQLDVCRTWPGETTLASWLSAPAPAPVVARRQQAVRELRDCVELREQIALAAMEAASATADTGPIVEWASANRGVETIRSRRLGVVGALLVAATVGLIALDAAGGPGWSRGWAVLVVAQLGLILGLRGRLESVIGPVGTRSQPLGRYHRIFALLEQASFEAPRLQTLQRRLQSATGQRASQELARLESLASYVAVRHNAFVHIPANALLLWDLWCARALERWRRRCGVDLARWLLTLGELEALGSLANFAYEHPTYAFPEVREGPAQLRARALGHPLIPPDRRVHNDLELGPKPAALMVTGSNMSGKSTFLRAVGVNCVLAQAGAPVCADGLELSELGVRTCMRVEDSLDQGISRFYRELLRLKRVVDSLDEPGPPVLFLLDEILHGTNSRERNIGGRAIVADLVARGAIGLVSSHDLGLTSLEEHTGGLVANAHFTDQLAADRMAFDYRLRPGPVDTPNALRLMRQVGLAIELDVDPDGPAPAAGG